MFGLLWALAEPLSVVVVYVVVFGHILGAARSTANYSYFSLFGVLPWLFFSATLEQASNTLLEHAPLARKIFFPWELLIISVVISRLTTLLAGVALGLLIAVVTGAPLVWERLWLLPCGLALLCALTFGLSLVTSSLQALLRDTAFLVRFVLRVGFFACPIVYPLSMVPPTWRPLYELNPLVGVIWMFQAASDASLAQPSPSGLAASIVGAVVALGGGWWAFRRLRDSVADVL